MRQLRSFLLFFFNDTATTEIYTLSLHDALPISSCSAPSLWGWSPPQRRGRHALRRFADAHSSPGCFLLRLDRKSTRLNSSHGYISYAVFCLQKKKTPWLARVADEQLLPDMT